MKGAQVFLCGCSPAPQVLTFCTELGNIPLDALLAGSLAGPLFGKTALLRAPEHCILGIVVPEQEAGWAPDYGSGRQPGCHDSSWAGATEPSHSWLCWL